MKSFVSLLFACLIPLSALGQVSILDTADTFLQQPGKYFAQIEVSQAGDVTISQIAKVVKVTGKPTPPNPNPETLSPKAKEVKAAAEKANADPNRANTAVGLAEAAKSVKSLVDDGTLKNYEQISKALAYLWDATAKHEAWKDTRSLVFKQLAFLAQEGATTSAYGGYLVDVEKGMRASVIQSELQGDVNTGEVEINGQVIKADWSEIMKILLEFFVKYILPKII